MAGKLINVTFGNLVEVERRMKAYAKADVHVRDMAKVLNRTASKVLLAAVLLVPVDLGTLRASGLVEPPIISGTKVRIVVAFGGPAASYAYIVHEDLEAHHTVGQAKYLETAARAQHDGTLADLVATTRRTRREMLAARRAA